MSTYRVDRIRNIGILTEGYTYRDVVDYLTVATMQKCRDFVECQGKRYPVTIIGDDCFPIIRYSDYGSVQRLEIPKGVQRIANKAFSHWCFCDECVELPETLLEIGKEAFLNSEIKRIVIPPNVINVGENAFPSEMDVVCMSPYLIRQEGNKFCYRSFITDDGLFEYRITNPIKREVSIIKLVMGFEDELVVPESIFIGEDKFIVTGLDGGFLGSIYDIKGNPLNQFAIHLPCKLRKIGNSNFATPYFVFLPNTIKYIGSHVFFIAMHPDETFMHLPKYLRFVGKDNDLNDNNTTDSPNININDQVVLDDDGNPLYFFGDDTAKEAEAISRIAKSFFHFKDGFFDWIDSFDYSNYDFFDYLDSSTF